MKHIFGKSLDEMKNDKFLENDAHSYRLKGIDPNKQAIHDEKVKEAKSYLDGENRSSGYPYLETYAKVHGIHCDEVAQIFLSKATEQKNRSVKIEYYRELNKVLIRDCKSIVDIKKLELKWPE